MTDPLHFLSIVEANARIASGDLSPVTLLDTMLERIEATDEQLNSYVRLMHDSARDEAEAAAERARAGTRRGPLDGIPIALKDIYDTGGVLTTAGTAAFRDRVPREDATTVRRLREAGAVVVGKTNTHELALGGTTNNPHYGPTHNPWHLDRVPGGSSGGSAAAVAAGQCFMGMGTDTAASIRIPAAFCGITGHKPTFGLVGRGGIVPLSLTLDHAGPLARSALDCALSLNPLAGYDERDHDSVDRPAEDFAEGIDRDIRGLRLAVIPSLVEGSAEAVAENFERSLDVLRELGAEIVTAEPMAGINDWRAPLARLVLAEGATYIEDTLRHRAELVGELVRRRMLLGLEVMATEYVRALGARKEVQARFERTLAERRIDAYLCPTAPQAAEPIGQDDHVGAAPSEKTRCTSVFNYSHQPSISVPNGFDADGLPTGLMISGALWQDALVLRIGHAYQQAIDFHLQRPPL